jgi:hypothetical protein
MTLMNRFRVWWYGAPSVITLTELDGGGLRFAYPDPSHVPARARFKAAIEKPLVKWLLAGVGTIVIAIASAAIIKSLGLT